MGPKNPVTGTKTVYYGDGTVVTSPDPNWSCPLLRLKGVDERISDSTGKGRPHGCLHRKVEFEIKSQPPLWPVATAPWGYYTWGGDSNTFSQAYYACASMGYLMGWDLTSSSTNPPGWVVSYAPVADQVAINDLMGRLNSNVADAPLNIIEGSEIWPSVNSLADCLPEMARNWRSIRKVVRTASSSFLAWKFGIAPLMSDLEKIAKFGPDMQRQFEQSQKNSIRRVSKVYLGSALFAGVGNGMTGNANGINTIQSTYQGLAVGAPTTRYVLVAKSNAPKYQSEAFAKLDFLMRRFTTSPASLAWERKPFSFVYDWFVDLRGTLRTIDSSLGVKPWEVISCTKSKSFVLQSESFLTLRSSKTGAGVIFDARTGTVINRHYERIPLSSDGFMPTWNNRFGKNQAAVSAALILQNLLKTKRS